MRIKNDRPRQGRFKFTGVHLVGEALFSVQ